MVSTIVLTPFPFTLPGTHPPTSFLSQLKVIHPSNVPKSSAYSSFPPPMWEIVLPYKSLRCKCCLFFLLLMGFFIASPSSTPSFRTLFFSPYFVVHYSFRKFECKVLSLVLGPVPVTEQIRLTEDVLYISRRFLFCIIIQSFNDVKKNLFFQAI